MTRIHFVAIAAVFVLGHAAGASAQTAPTAQAAAAFVPQQQIIQVDPLDPMAVFAARIASGTSGRDTIVMNTVPGATFVDPYAEYRDQYMQYLAQYAQYAEGAATRSDKSRWASAVEGIGTGMQLSHGALDVYQHAIEVQALRNSLKSN